MTGEHNCKIPKAILINSLPKALVNKLGGELILKLCRKYDYRTRSHVKKCPNCKSKNGLRYRSGTHDYRCADCHVIVPKTKKPVGLNTSAINAIIIDRSLDDTEDD
ncbi:MAG: hypothetical protein EHM34_06400 [Nitrosopumilales archaeon]|nr:MAG: hypothetical protein EHM34_06400 [Nitrosopumilales archaeon]